MAEVNRQLKKGENQETYDQIYDRIVEDLKGNLSNKEYRDLIALEYIISQGYENLGDVELYMELSKRR